jgi:hypothetical protein
LCGAALFVFAREPQMAGIDGLHVG